MGQRFVEPGTVLADRYVVEDLLAEEGESDSWRARDRVLARSVVLQILPSSSPYAAELLAAAKRASRVADPRHLQVLDAVDDGRLAYVVREWATGQSLDVVLSEGPLPARRAAWLLREVAAAMANAHRLGLAHRRLAPDTVVITKSSGVKLIGLGTFAALRTDADATGDPQVADTIDLGRLLYACLTSRWPGPQISALPPAPTEHGRLLRPRQVRAGVPRSLDALCDRILGTPPRYGAPITTVTEVKDALTTILSEEGFNSTTGVGLANPPATSAQLSEPHPALLHNDDDGPPTGGQPVYTDTNSNGEPSQLGRTLMWVVVAVLIVGALLLAYLIGQHGANQPTDSSTSATNTTTQSVSPSAPLPLQIATAQDFDPPPGSGDENPDLVPLAVDGDPASAWETLSYRGDPHLGGLKDGVGLIIDLGGPQAVRAVNVTVQGDGTSLELRAAPESATSAPTDSADSYQLLDSVSGAGQQVRLSLEEAVRTRFLLLWLTELPSEGGDSFRGRVADVKVFG